MKLALYLPNFRDKVTVKELEDLTNLAEELDFDSVWTLDRTCLEHIARYKRPKDYRFVDSLPTNNYGKVVKRELRDQLRAEAEG